MLYIGTDHRGLKLKQQLVDFIKSLDIEIRDIGAFEYDKEDDYNDYAEQVAKRVRTGVTNLGIILCGSGNGVAVVCNKHKDIRCSLAFNKEVAKQSKTHLACNIIAIPADHVDFETAKEIVLEFLKNSFDNEERHERRLQKILKLEITSENLA